MLKRHSEAGYAIIAAMEPLEKDAMLIEAFRCYIIASGRIELDDELTMFGFAFINLARETAGRSNEWIAAILGIEVDNLILLENNYVGKTVVRV
jgi:hypothetical protein